MDKSRRHFPVLTTVDLLKLYGKIWCNINAIISTSDFRLTRPGPGVGSLARAILGFRRALTLSSTAPFSLFNFPTQIEFPWYFSFYPNVCDIITPRLLMFLSVQWKYLQDSRLTMSILALLSWLLIFSNMVSAAAIPRVPHPTSDHTEKLDASVLTKAPSIQSAQHDDSSHRAKREPYYFPETVPDSDDTGEQKSILRDVIVIITSGSVDHKQSSQSIGTSKIMINIGLPHRDAISDSSIWDSVFMIPPFGFFVIAAMVVCVATVVRSISDD